MRQASNLRRLAERRPERIRGDVKAFIQANADDIRAAQALGHSWSAIYKVAVDDGCPSRSLKYFQTKAEKILGAGTRDASQDRAGRRGRSTASDPGGNGSSSSAAILERPPEALDGTPKESEPAVPSSTIGQYGSEPAAAKPRTSGSLRDRLKDVD